MDRRATVAVFVGILLLLFIGRNKVLMLYTRAGGIELLPGNDEIVELPPIKLPALPTFKPGPEMWTQSTGLMCACDVQGYVGPVLLREYEIPPAPIARYVYQPKPIVAQAAEPARRMWPAMAVGTADDKAANPFAYYYAFWQGRPPGNIFIGSDGRVFARERGPASSQIIGPDEYTFDGRTLTYGPYTYNFNSGQGFSAGGM